MTNRENLLMNTEIRTAWKRRLYAAVAALTLGWSWIAPSPASLLGSLPSPLGSLIVTITAPASGSTVSGTTRVSASVSIVGSLTVAGVQFQLDGANLGAEDTAAPYSVSWNTITTGNGPHTLTAVARDVLGLQYASRPVTVTVFNDAAPPSVSIASPVNGATVGGTITVAATASDNVGVAGVRFKLDGADLGVEDTTAPYAVPWDTAATSDGFHVLTAVARDAAGNVATSAAVTVTVSNAPPPDGTAPAVSITSPGSGATVSNTITITADASDNVGVAGVQFFVDGATLGAEDTTAPYSLSWDTTKAGNGSHTLTARARDAAGNAGFSGPITVTVSNGGVDGVAWTSPVNVTAMGSSLKKTSGSQEAEDAGAVSAQTISSSGGYVQFVATGGDDTLTVGLSHDNPDTGSAAIDFGIKVWAPNSVYVIENGRPVANEAFASTSVFRIAVESGVVSYSRDGRVFYTSTVAPTFPLMVDTSLQTLGAAAWDVVISNGTAPTSDTTPPAAAITLPRAGSTVSGSVVVAADAWDDVSVAGVRFFVDGAAMGTEDTTRPYVITWDTTKVADGPHTLTAVARDAAGNTATSSPVTVTVSNAASPPPPTRHEETDPAIVYSPGNWISDSTYGPWSGGSAMYTVTAGAQATFTFTGTGVSWIGYRGRYGGIVRVYLDGALAAELDTYSTTEEVSVPVYTATGLAAGSHTLMVELTGTKNPSATNNETAVDAFDVTP